MSIAPSHPWSPGRDKNLKTDVVHAGGNAITNAMKEWLQHYNPPATSPPARPANYYEERQAALYARLAEKQQRNRAGALADQQTLLPPRSSEFYTAKRARLYARLAEKRARMLRVADLVNRRARAIASSARRYPRSRSHPHHHDNIALELVRRRRKEVRIVEEKSRREAEEIARRVAAEARVAQLVALREAGRRSRLSHGLL
ncbi:hypothetical protein R3P38DRAFT_3201684 [Favolaschia claudopus]|uniref:Uncharacterized protein n=1 Tax=Favolaschia claudopus TaxID=2862362 RepID=A0AAW0AUW2_9AGAR